MLEFAFVTALMICLSAVLYLMVRALPRIAEEPAGESTESKGMLDRWAHSDLPEKIDIFLNSFLFKFLRKIKVVVLKLDNSLGSHLQRMKAKEEEHERKAAINFQDIAQGAEERRVEDRRRFGRRASDRPVDIVKSAEPAQDDVIV